MGQREDIWTIAYCVVDRHGSDTAAYIARQIETAETLRDGLLVTKWLLVREALREMAEPAASARQRVT